MTEITRPLEVMVTLQSIFARQVYEKGDFLHFWILSAVALLLMEGIAITSQ